MIALSKNEIINLPVSSKERAHHSRSRKGYHVFLSWYFGKYNLLSKEDKHTMFPSSNPSTVGTSEDDDSIDSASTPPTIHVSAVMKAAASLWKSSTREHKDGWVERANQLNQSPLLGSFKEIPTEIFVDGIEYNVRLSLQSDWSYVVKRLRAMITKAPQRHIASLTYRFGRERVCMIGQSFASFQLNYLIRFCIFGKDFCKLKSAELVYQSKRVTIIHISSIERVRELFTVSGLCGVVFDEQNHKFSACAKVAVQSNGKEMAGYVLSCSTKNKMKVHMVDNSIIECDCPKWNDADHNYDYVQSVDAHYIKEFVPIRFAIMTSGEVKITLNRFTVDHDGELFQHRCS